MSDHWPCISPHPHKERNSTRMPIKYNPLYNSPHSLLGNVRLGIDRVTCGGRNWKNHTLCVCRRCCIHSYLKIGHSKTVGVHIYKHTSRAQINARKSKALALGGWARSQDFHGILYMDEIHIFSITFQETVS